MKLDGEIALAAGGTSGIGLATAGKEASIVRRVHRQRVSWQTVAAISPRRRLHHQRRLPAAGDPLGQLS